MARLVNIYVKKTLRLDLLTVPQRQMYQLGQVGLESIHKRTAYARGSDDRPAPPLQSERWKRIKKARGLRPIRDLRGTGMMPQKGGKRAGRLKRVGHLMDQILVRRVGDTRVKIEEPSTRAGRIKARRNRWMLLFSPRDKAFIVLAANQVLKSLKARLIRVSSPGQPR